MNCLKTYIGETGHLFKQDSLYIALKLKKLVPNLTPGHKENLPLIVKSTNQPSLNIQHVGSSNQVIG